MKETFFESAASEKQKRIAEIFSFENNGDKITFVPDAIVALSGSIVETKGDRPGYEGYKSPSYADADNKGHASGGKARVIAVAEAHEYFPEAKIVTTSKDAHEESGRPTHASVYAHELLKLGVLEEALVTEEDTHTTLTGLLELIRLAEEEHTEWNSIAAVSNEYHIPRIQAMLQRLPKLIDENDPKQEQIRHFVESGKMIVPIAAEELLEVRDRRYRELFEQVKQTEAYQKRVEAEKKGVVDLEEGIYDTNLPSTH